MHWKDLHTEIAFKYSKSGWLLDLKTFISHFAASLEMRYLYFDMLVKVYFVLLVCFSYVFLHLVNKFELLLITLSEHNMKIVSAQVEKSFHIQLMFFLAGSSTS